MCALLTCHCLMGEKTGIATRANQEQRAIALIPNPFANKRFSSASSPYSAQISLQFEPPFLTLVCGGSSPFSPRRRQERQESG
jgi:hypothetical protein